MTKGIREELIQTLKDAGFRKPEAESLVSTWNNAVRPAMIGLFTDISVVIREEYNDGAPLTNEITIEILGRVREMFQAHR